jgi:hypothetical protein
VPYEKLQEDYYNDLGRFWKEAPMILFWCVAWREENPETSAAGLLDEIQTRGIRNMKEEG